MFMTKVGGSVVNAAEHDISLSSGELASAVLPDVCARHGLAATSRQQLALTVRKRMPDDPMILNTNVVAMAARAREQLVQGAVKREDWPLCSRCASTRNTNLLLAKTLGVAGVVLLVVAVVLAIASGPGAVAGVLFAAGLLCFPAALVLGLNSRVASVARITLSQDRTRVFIHEPSQAFEQQWRARNA
jgi:hypothetical protein